MGKRKPESGGLVGCLSILLMIPFGVAAYGAGGGFAALAVCVFIILVMGLIQMKIDASHEYAAIEKQEKDRIRRSALRLEARRDLLAEEFPELKKSGTRRRDPLPGHVMEAVFERDEGKCVSCGSQDDLQFDHVIPHSKGGADTVGNLRILCRHCNQARGNRFR